MDLARAFTYPFDDQEWTPKLLITVVISLIPIVNFAALGWALDLIKNMMAGVQNPMPDWNDIGDQFVQRWIAGLLLAVGIFIYYLPLLIINAILGGVITSILFAGRTVDLGLLFWAVPCCTGLVSIVYSVVIWFPLSVGVMRHAHDRQFMSLLELPRNISIAMNNTSTMTILAIFIFAVTVIMSLVGLIPLHRLAVVLAGPGRLCGCRGTPARPGRRAHHGQARRERLTRGDSGARQRAISLPFA